MARLKIAIYSPNRDRNPGLRYARAFQDLGHQVVVFNHHLSIPTGDFDFFLWDDDADNHVYPKTSRPSFYIAIDTHTDSYRSLLQSTYMDYVCYALKPADALFVHRGEWVPSAFDSSLKINDYDQIKPWSRRSIDVVCVGEFRPEKRPERQLIKKLCEENFAHTFFSNDIKYDQIQSIYGNSKIVINPTLKGDLNLRFFEATGYGAI